MVANSQVQLLTMIPLLEADTSVKRSELKMELQCLTLETTTCKIVNCDLQIYTSKLCYSWHKALPQTHSQYYNNRNHSCSCATNKPYTSPQHCAYVIRTASHKHPARYLHSIGHHLLLLLHGRRWGYPCSCRQGEEPHTWIL